MFAVMVGALLALPSADATAVSAKPTKSLVRPTVNVVVIGDTFSYGYSSSTDPVLRLSVPPTLAALNQVQLADQAVQIKVLFIPVWEATWNQLYSSGSGGAGSGQPPLINSVKDANVVIAGVGADVPRFAASLRKVLFGKRVSPRVYRPLMAIFKNGSYQRNETAYLDDIAARMAPGGAVVSLGYPRVSETRRSSGRTWWSPLNWSTVGRGRARQIDRLVSKLDTANTTATRRAGTRYQGVHLLYADLSAMPSGLSAQGAQAIALKETLIGNALLPYVNQAVGDEVTAMGAHSSAAVLPITPASRWDLTVQLPTGARVPLPQPSPRPGGRQAATSQVTPSQRGLTNTQASQGQGTGVPRRVAIKVPMIPAPAAPIPKPIAPASLPAAIGGRAGGAQGSSGSSNQGSSPSGNGTSSPGTSSSGAGTTSPGSGTTSPGGGTTSGGGSTSSSLGPSSSASGSPSSSASPSSSGGSSSWGGSSSGGGSSAS